MTKRNLYAPLIQCSALLAGLALPGVAVANGFVTDEKSKCQVWAPSRLNTTDYLLRYQGDCRGGRADGKGKAEWLDAYTENRVAYTWAGRFRNGVFIGDQPVEGNVEGLPSDQYLVEMGKLADAQVVFVSTSGQASPMNLCEVDQLALVVDPKVEAREDQRIRSLMRDAAERFRAICPQAKNSDFRINAYRPPFKPNPSNHLPQPFADISFAPSKSGDDAFSYYHNKAVEAQENDKLKQAYQHKQADKRSKFMAFSRANKVESWVTSASLDKKDRKSVV